jgi:hypothetical protein
MSPRSVWIGLIVFYAVFFGWYTSFGGPLTPDEVSGYVALLEERGLEPARVAVWRTFMESDTGDDFAMLNAIDLRDTPLSVEGVSPGATSEEVLAQYTRPFLGRALRRASHPILLGAAAGPAMDLWGIEDAEHWDTGGLVRYRSRRDLIEQAVAIGPTGVHEFKLAAMEKTIAFPLDPWFHLGDPRLLLGLLLMCVGLASQLRASARGSRPPESPAPSA